MGEKINFFVFNIKLQSKKTDLQRVQEYRNLIQKLTEKNKILATKSNHGIIMYSSHGQDSSPYIYGRAAKGLYIPGDEISKLKSGSITKEENDPNSLIDPTIIRYIFIPEAHRLCVEKKPKGPSETEIEMYLQSFLIKLTDKDDILEIVLEKDSKAIEEIFDAHSVLELSYRISYTNEDINKDLAELFDKELKESNIGEISVIAKADNKLEGMKVENSMMIGGGLQLAESNGEIKRAVITQKGSPRKKRVITNKDKPKILCFEMDEKDNFWHVWYKKILSIYRNNQTK